MSFAVFFFFNFSLLLIYQERREGPGLIIFTVGCLPKYLTWPHTLRTTFFLVPCRQSVCVKEF